MRKRWNTAATLLVAGVLFAPAAASAAEETTSCVACHSQLEDNLLRPVRLWKDDVHAAAGLGCNDCHGGDPSPALADDTDAMSPRKGFRGAPDRLHVPDFCGRCHSDASYMRKYNPQERVDQLKEYRTSLHGRRNAQGDPVPAVCTDCHGIHGIRPVNRPDSPVYPTNVPDTCASCHADREKMAPYGKPTDQYALYRRSVHGLALLERGDTGAPACNDCHGNHGAAPPGVTSVSNVCGQCHALEAKLFRRSFKKDIFDAMDAPECTKCHGNHLVMHPVPGMFHSSSGPEVSQGRILSREPFAADFGKVEPGTTASATWSVIMAPHETRNRDQYGHVIRVETSEGSRLELDASVAPGDDAGAVGVRRAKSDAVEAVLHIESQSGWPVQAGDELRFKLEVKARASSIVRIHDQPGVLLYSLRGSVCLQCHTPGDRCDQATEKMYDALIGLDRELRQAGSLLHRAEVAGVEVSGPIFKLRSDGRTAQIESRSLIHSFDPDRVLARIQEGTGIAAEAMKAARAALREIQSRRKWLAISLVLVVFVLVALYLKIRELNRRRKLEAASTSSTPAPARGGQQP